MKMNTAFASGLLGLGLIVSAAASAQLASGAPAAAAPETAAEAPAGSGATPAVVDERENSPLYRGSYFAPLGTFVRQFGSKGQTGNGFGGTLGIGYRQGFFSIEGRGYFTTLNVHGGDPGVSKDAQLKGFSLDGMLFPFAASPSGLFQNVYGIIGVGAFEARKYPTNTHSLDAATFEGGVGDFIPLKIGNYEFGIRGEALFRYGNRLQRLGPKQDIDAPLGFEHLLVNVGLQLPLALKHEVQAPPPEPVKVVPVGDADGDGVLDDADQCPDTPKGTPVDARGCPLPKPVCKTPAAGERLTLEGCGAGDVIVLDGVNFEFNQARLTLNARAILDGVAEELGAHPDIQIELGGHTDSRGTDDYNQKLSESRAQAVLAYLKDKGVAGSRMTAVGYGETRPVDSNDSDSGRERNRRVELKVTASGSGGAAGASPPAQ